MTRPPDDEMTGFTLRMERETGIEPATNSLEGCDSTTELLPPSRSLTRLPTTARSSRFGGQARLFHLRLFARPLLSASPTSVGLPTVARALVGKRERRLVGRGGFEPP